MIISTVSEIYVERIKDPPIQEAILENIWAF
jgi:hypothetical protein